VTAQATTDELYDLVVIGGGINGTGIAADAAGRGLKVLLAEAGDLGGATSSASSKLIHGGLRYLEQFHFRLVREALAEREILLAKAPHIVRPLRFILPHVDGMRPAWMLRIGLFLYDHLASRRTLGASTGLDLSRDAAGRPLAEHLKRGFAYWDCQVDDARLVVLNAIAAAEAGADIRTRTPVSRFSVNQDLWTIALGKPGAVETVRARALVNAAGPWVASVAKLSQPHYSASLPRVRLVKGSHIVVPRLEGANEAYLFQNSDGRVVFALPFEAAFTLIGTTDESFQGDPKDAHISDSEIDYLLDLANRFFRNPITREMIVWSFAGVRPLDDDGAGDPSAVSRDYRLHLDMSAGPPLLHVIGGKITTYRRLAESALAKLAPHLPPMQPAWTASRPLPGGDVGPGGFDAWFDDLTHRFPGVPKSDLRRFAKRYGTRVTQMLDAAKTLNDLGADLGFGLRQREVAYLKQKEWARTAEDVLWRRTKTGLHIPRAHLPLVSEAIETCLDAT
jgi:glycerol-3-phosphate dehydrogenase